MRFPENTDEITIDRIDRKILRILQDDGRIANVALAKRVGLSATACLERVKKLEREGVIESYHARINPAKLGANLMVFVEITLSRTSADAFAEFSEQHVKLKKYWNAVWSPATLIFSSRREYPICVLTVNYSVKPC